MNGVASKIVGGTLLVLTAMALVVLSALPYDAEDPSSGMICLSWRYRISATQECRTRSQQELDALPVHMRTPEVCERRIPTYRMSLEVDGNSVFEDVIRPAGAAGDRPLYVHRDLEVAAGEHRISVRFAPLTDGGIAENELSFDRSVTISPGEVLLVTYDPDQGRLDLVGSTRGGG